MRNAGCPLIGSGRSAMAEHEEGKPLENYSVGYGKPPVGSRFKKGQSGNPTGRPKGTLNFSTALLKALSEKISVTENGRPKRISKLDAMLKQIINKAVNGNLQAAS